MAETDLVDFDVLLAFIEEYDPVKNQVCKPEAFEQIKRLLAAQLIDSGIEELKMFEEEIIRKDSQIQDLTKWVIELSNVPDTMGGGSDDQRSVSMSPRRVHVSAQAMANINPDNMPSLFAMTPPMQSPVLSMRRSEVKAALQDKVDKSSMGKLSKMIKTREQMLEDELFQLQKNTKKETDRLKALVSKLELENKKLSEELNAARDKTDAT